MSGATLVSNLLKYKDIKTIYIIVKSKVEKANHSQYYINLPLDFLNTLIKNGF